MKNNDDYLETNVDRLYKLVKDKKRVKISEASEEIGAKKEFIEEWAKILEEHGLIKIYYPIIGDTELRIVEKGGGNEKTS